jgi:hypothetical protein
MNCALVFMVLPVALACRISLAQPDSSLYGKWVGYSKAIYSVCGDLILTPDALTLEKKGRASYSVLARIGDSIVVETDSDVGCGRYIRLGPILRDGDMFAGYMEFAVYRSRESSFAGAQLRSAARSPKGMTIARGVSTHDESNQPLVPTRTGAAPLLAAQWQR